VKCARWSNPAGIRFSFPHKIRINKISSFCRSEQIDGATIDGTMGA
jgi:hypothetical protein